MISAFQFRNMSIAVLASAAMVLSSCAQKPEVVSARYLQAGKKLLLKHDPARAILQFKNALKTTPDDPEIYYQLGEAFSAGKDFVSALGAYEKAVELNPRHARAMLRLGQMMTASNDPDVVKNGLEQLNKLINGQTPTPEVLNTLAFAELRLGHIDNAISSVNRVLAEAPGELGALSILAGAKLMSKDAKGAEEVLLKACQEAPKSAEARRFLAEFYVDQKRFAEAENLLKQALTIDSENGQVLMDLARLQLEENKHQEADQTFKRLTKLEGYRSVHAIFLFQDGRRDQAVRELEALVKQNPEDRQLRSNLVAMYQTAGRSGDAGKLLAEAIKKNPKDLDALLQQGELAIGKGDFGVAETDLNQVLSFKPDAPEVHYLLAKLNQARGATLTYRQELSESLRLNPNLIAVRVELAQALSGPQSAGGRAEASAHAALSILDAAPAFQKGSLPLLVQRNWELLTLRDYAGMRKGIDEALAQGRSPELLIQFGMWKLGTGDPAGARKLLEEALKLDPNNLRALQALTQTYVAEKNSPLAVEAAKKYAQERPQSAPAQDFLGVLLMASGDRKGAKAAFEAAKRADPTFTKSDLAMAMVDAAENRFQEARDRLEAVVKTDSNNLTARLWLGNLEEVLGHHDTAIEDFRKVLQNDPENAQAANNLAYLLAEYENQPDEALKYAEKAVNVAPQKASYADTMGWTLYRKGMYSSAINYLERAVADKSPDVIWRYHLAMAYAKSGDANRGRAILENALKINPNLPEAKTAQAVLSEHR